LTENPNEVLLEGAQVVEHVKDKPPMTMIGHVTSGYYSPNAGRSIAMAVIKDGRNRMGQTVYLPYEGKVVAAKISKPTFLEDGAPANG
jgi:sarcosine oxidase subunit alpha